MKIIMAFLYSKILQFCYLKFGGQREKEIKSQQQNKAKQKYSPKKEIRKTQQRKCQPSNSSFPF